MLLIDTNLPSSRFWSSRIARRVSFPGFPLPSQALNRNSSWLQECYFARPNRYERIATGSSQVALGIAAIEDLKDYIGTVFAESDFLLVHGLAAVPGAQAEVDTGSSSVDTSTGPAPAAGMVSRFLGAQFKLQTWPLSKKEAGSVERSD